MSYLYLLFWGGGIFSRDIIRQGRVYTVQIRVHPSPHITVAPGVYLSEAQNPIPLPPYTLYTCMDSILTVFTQGMGEGGELNQREG
jgi:hypothetical protein